MSAAHRVSVSPATVRVRDTLIAAGRLGAGLLAATLAVAALVAGFAAPAARDWLAYTFPGLPRTAGEAAAIAVHNLRILGGVAGLLLLAGLPCKTARERAAITLLRLVGEILIAGLTLANVLLVGTALGAYGQRMLVALLPQGPVELAGFALALALYARAREGSYPRRAALGVLATSAALLAAAAVLEVYAAS